MNQEYEAWDPPYVQWVVKVSKFCNLRCRYCYEFPHLHEKARMSLDQVERLFVNIAAHYAGSGKSMEFVWHGGEPLLVEPEFYTRVGVLQRSILSAQGLRYSNTVQTNLTVLNPEVLDVMKGFFHLVGVSVDLAGGLRVNVAGREVEQKVVQNIASLQEAGIRFGCISVLSTATAPFVEQIFDFFHTIGASFRFLPIYRTGFSGQQDGLALYDDAVVDAYCRTFERWLATSRVPVRVRPIEDYVINVIRRNSGSVVGFRQYRKTDVEVLFLVDTDGAIFSVADAYSPEHRGGSLFDLTLAQCRSLPTYRRSIAESENRIKEACRRCRYAGACSGYFVGEATPEQRRPREGRETCPIAARMHQYIEQRFKDIGVLNDAGFDLQCLGHLSQTGLVPGGASRLGAWEAEA